MSKEIRVQDDALRLNQDYKHFLTDIKTRLQTAQIRAALATNSELIQFYWGLGTELIEKQKSHQWGTHFLEQFSHDMKQEFPEMQGFSVTNLKRMRMFAQAYPDFKIGAQAVHHYPGDILLFFCTRQTMKMSVYGMQQSKLSKMVGHEPFLKCRSKVDYMSAKRLPAIKFPITTSNYPNYNPI